MPLRLAPAVERNVELGYAEKTTDSTTASTTLADVAGLSVTVTVGDRPILLAAHFPGVRHGAAGGLAVAEIVEGTTQLAFGQHSSSAAAETGSLDVKRRLAPTAGVHTYKVRIAISAFGTAGTATFAGAATAPVFIQAVEL